tara:strand:+ start:190 stop:1044 length:855 start_codon:yes stop_codon:yes gene_type:complete
MSSKDKKKALLVGIGKWGEVLANILIKKGYQVSYVSRDKSQKLSFEMKFKTDFIKHFSCNDEIIFDLVVIAVQPKDFYDAWKEYKIYSKKFLIEKPGALNKNEIQKIFLEAFKEGKSILINYEYIYTAETRLLLEKLIEEKNDIEEIVIIWEKKLYKNGNLHWRLLPHLIADLIIISKENLSFTKSQIKENSIKLMGIIMNAKFSIEFNDKEKTFYQNKIRLSNKKVFIKERNKLLLGDKVIYNKQILSVDKMVDLSQEATKEQIDFNNNLATDVLSVIEKINV